MQFPDRQLSEILAGTPRRIRRAILEACAASGEGHLASALSCVEILVTLYHGGFLHHVDPTNPADPERDRFILSKGHAAIALYAVLADRGFFPAEELTTFCAAGSRLGPHVEAIVPGVEVTTGSLGHGLSIATGMAFAAQQDGARHDVVVLLGDGECYEGSIWEAAMFAGHHELRRLFAIIDCNRMCATDWTSQVVRVEPLFARWAEFGWDVRVTDGHSLTQLSYQLNDLRRATSPRPKLLIAETTKGQGIPFMVHHPEWHSRKLSPAEIEQARLELQDPIPCPH